MGRRQICVALFKTLILCSTGFNLKILLAARTLYLCDFVWISEQTVFSSPVRSWLVSLSEVRCVYCAVRTEPLHTVKVHLLKGFVTLGRFQIRRPNFGGDIHC